MSEPNLNLPSYAYGFYVTISKETGKLVIGPAEPPKHEPKAKPEPVSQSAMVQLFMTLWIFSSQVYKKVQPVFARSIVDPNGEDIETWVNGKLETKNHGKQGDYVVKNVGGEQYLFIFAPCH